jgi:transposase
LLSLINSTLVDVSIKEDIGYQSIQAIVDRQIEIQVNWQSVKEIGLLSIDEISLKKGHRDFVTLVTCRTKDNLQILSVLKGHEKTTISVFLSSIPIQLRKTIVAVCTDMYDAYVNAAREVFGKSIPVIVDRFHVAQLYRKSLVSLRKHELKYLKKNLSAEEYRALKPAMAILCHSKEFMTPEEKKIVTPLFKCAPLLLMAYNFCCALTGIYNSHINPAEAHEKIESWITAVESSQLICFNRFIKTLKKYQTEIENYFINREISGFVEGINNKAKVLKRRCYGIFNLKHFFQHLFLYFSGYENFAKAQRVSYARFHAKY